jgi:ribonuclease P protein subunit POP4
MITPSNIVRHELIGLRVEIVNARNNRNVGLKGNVVDETYHTTVIEVGGVEKRIFKKQTTFRFTLPSGVKVDVDGNLLVARPWDRIKKKLRKI